MTPGLHQRSKEIFVQIAESPPDRWEALVEARCDGDAALEHEVRSLLEVVGRGRLLPTGTLVPDAAVPGATSIIPPPPALPQRIGPFRPIRRLGAGGMGEVYEAIQDHPRRSVAIKVIRGAAESDATRRRFEFEAQALGRLHHPGIATIYEAGEETIDAWTRHYLVMELVHSAQTLTQHAQTRSLDLRARLTLFIAVCDAVQHAHFAGVIHRDLKPENILVDPTGQPKIIDFGIALGVEQATSPDARLTFPAMLVGTPAYMAPEQHDADLTGVDSRCDVYALGVVLYELLTGHLPHDPSGLALHEFCRRVREAPPRAPAIHNPALRGDLTAIILKAIEPDRTRRYQTPDRLAHDLRQYLQGGTIAARPRGGLDRARRWASTHPAVVAGAACALAGILLPVLLATVWGWNRINLLSERLRAFERLTVGGFMFVVEADARTLHAVAPDAPRDTPPLATWSTSSRFHPTRSYAKVETPRGVLAVVVTDHTLPAGTTVQTAEVFNPSNFGRPCWVAPHDPSDFEIPQFAPPAECPRPVTVDAAGGFTSLAIRVADVFPESPGQELIVIHVHAPDFPSCIRVYGWPEADDDATILYEAWNPGHVGHIAWNERAGVLVGIGVNNWLPRAGRPNIQGPRTPAVTVLFGLRPILGRRNTDWIDAVPARDSPDLAWMLVIRHESLNSMLSVAEVGPDTQVPRRDNVIEAALTAAWQTGDFLPRTSFLIDAATGRLASDDDQSRLITDGFRNAWQEHQAEVRSPLPGTPDLLGPMPAAFPFEPLEVAQREGLIGFPSLDWGGWTPPSPREQGSPHGEP